MPSCQPPEQGFVASAPRQSWAWFLLCMTSRPRSAGPTIRPQVEQFVGCLATTGQEAPDTGRKLLVDLFKKCLSGDGISGPPAEASPTLVPALGWSSASRSGNCSATLSRGQMRLDTIDRSCLTPHRPKVVHASGACACSHVGLIERRKPMPLGWPGDCAQDVNPMGSSRACSSCSVGRG